MRGTRKFCQRGSNFNRFFWLFLVNERRDDPNTTISGTLRAHQRNTIYDGPTLNSGLVALWFFRRFGPELLRNPKFCDFQEGFGPPYPPSGSAHGINESSYLSEKNIPITLSIS